MQHFFSKSAKQSVIDFEQDRASIRRNKVFEQIKTISRHAGSFLKKGFDTAAVRTELKEIMHWHQLSKDGVFNNQGSAHSSRNLTTTFNILNALKTEVSSSKRHVDNYQNQLINYRLQIDSLTSDKSLFVVAEDSSFLSQYLSRLHVLSKEISPVSVQLTKNINTIQTLQNELNLEMMALDNDTEEIRYYQQQIAERTFNREFAPLWSESTYNRPLKEILQMSVFKAKLALTYYLKANWGRLLLLISIVILVVYYLFSLKNSLKNQGQMPGESTMLLAQPVISGTVIALSVAQFLFVNPPFIFSTLFVVIEAILISILLRKHISSYWMLIWLSLLSLYLFAVLDNLVLQASRPERWYMMFIAGLTSIIGLFTLINRTQHVQLRERWILFPIGLMTIMEFMSLGLNLAGSFNISKVFLVTGLLNVVVTIIFLWVLRLVNEGLTYASSVYKKQERKLFYINYDRVGKRAPLFFYLVLIVGWFVLFGRNFYEFRLLSEPIHDFFYDTHHLGSYSFTVINILVFVLIMACSTILSKIVSFFAAGPQPHHTERDGSQFHLGSWLLLIRITIIFSGFFLAFAAVGIPIQQITLIIGALGVGIGFGLQTLVNNLVSGLIIAFEKPVNVDDTIEVGGQSGRVKSIGFRSSVIVTPEGASLIMPNGDLLNSRVINWSQGTARKRLSSHIEVKYGTDLDKVKSLLLAITEKNEQILSIPAPIVQFTSVSAQSVAIDFFFWVKTSRDTGQIKSDIMVAIDNTLRKEHIELALPTQQLILNKEESGRQTNPTD
ncbi:MAG: mechanosensitive ion channel [Sphingobacterium sp.]|nr:mechanosensitive ion channel [Sphingobacterium sp.]